MKLTNNTNATVDFVVKGEAKDGVPPTESLAPGETRSITGVDVNSPAVQGLIRSDAVTLHSTSSSSSSSRSKE